MTPARTLFPNKAPYTGIGGQDVATFQGDTGQPTATVEEPSHSKPRTGQWRGNRTPDSSGVTGAWAGTKQDSTGRGWTGIPRPRAPRRNGRSLARLEELGPSAPLEPAPRWAPPADPLLPAVYSTDGTGKVPGRDRCALITAVRVTLRGQKSV